MRISIVSVCAFVMCATPAWPAVPSRDGGSIVASPVTAAVGPAIAADPAFEHYVDMRLLGHAWADLDPVVMTDVGLQLAEAERILLRPHKAQITADQILALATKLAAERHDTATLGRIAKAAARHGKTALAAEAAADLKLAEQSRGLDLAMAVPIDSLSTSQFALYRGYIQDIQAAKAMADRRELKRIEEELSSLTGLPPKQVASLKSRAVEARAALSGAAGVPESDRSTFQTLEKISGRSRGDNVAFSEWDSTYTIPGGTVDAHVVLQGGTGSYTLKSDGSTGSLYNIRYVYSSPTVILIRGSWSLQGQSGNFEWRVPPDRSGIFGRWWASFGSGAWNGFRSDGG